MLRVLYEQRQNTMADEYQKLYDNFRWHVPRDFNIAKVCCFDWAPGLGHTHKEALRWQQPNHLEQSVSFAELGTLVCQLSNGLSKLGVIPGDRVIVVMSRPIETLAVMLACWASAAVAVPLSPAESEEALVVKLKQARSRLAFIDQHTAQTTLAAIGRCPLIQQVVGFDVHQGNVMSWHGFVARQSHQFQVAPALPSAPALMVWPEHAQRLFTADTALILPQQALIGNLPGFVASHNWFPAQATALQTTLMPWVEAGLMAAILPALYFGRAVIFDQSTTLSLASDASHLSTTPIRWCRWLKSTNQTLPSSLASVALIGDQLTPAWRTASVERTGISPNLATYMPGCGLALVQSHQKWPSESDDLFLTPGFKAQTIPDPDSTVSDQSTTGFLSVARVDTFEHTNPAQYVQAWPQKASFDSHGLGNDALWLATDLCVKTVDNQRFRLLGRSDQMVPTVLGQLNANQIEQRLLTIAEVWAAATFASPQKINALPNTIVVVLQLSPATATHQPNWRHDISLKVRGFIMEAIDSLSAQPPKTLLIKTGFIDHIEHDQVDQPLRQAWNKRLKLADIDFMPSAPLVSASRPLR
ncbi:MAG: AMP-binding protein [Orrella sp.]|jgi:acetyl-CoA synthetase|uniref:AMP-binding protein n=1 Tax=Orrella sp. TaxID=1921583 RepID=UPI003BE51592